MKARTYVATAVIVLGASMFMACGPEGGCGAPPPENTLTCGTGTVQRGNTCVPR